MMYNEFKNDFISDVYSNSIKLDHDQIKNILESLDRTHTKYDIFSKASNSDGSFINGVPATVYNYIDMKRAEGCVKGTLYIYRLMLEVFFQTVRKNPEHVTSDDIRNFLTTYQKNNPVSNRTLDKYRGYICAYFAYLHDYGYIPRNPGKQVNPIKYEIKHKDVLTEYECELLREACQTKRELAMIEFLIATACRIGELVKVKLKDIDWENNSVLFFGKGHKQGIGFFNARCRLALERYLEELQWYGYSKRCRAPNSKAMESEYLFIYDRAPFESLSTRGAEKIVSNIVARVDKISNKHITPHRLRATTATSCYERGMSLIDISQMLRHSKVDTTTIYLEQSIGRLKTEYNRFMP